jgi:hypothetical protein
VTPPASRATPGGRALLDLQAKAKVERRPTDELLVLYLLEAFLRRLSASPHRERFVLKGGVLLAAFGDRRPTRDVDFQARGLDNDAAATLAVVCSIASLPAEDGVVFDPASAISEAIRDGDAYQGIRVRMTASVDRARPRFAVDISVGDPIEPGPQEVLLPTLLGQPPVSLLGYPLPMVLAEKIVTALERGTANTRWRDFADVWTLSRRHDCGGWSCRRRCRGLRSIAAPIWCRYCQLSTTSRSSRRAGGERGGRGRTCRSPFQSSSEIC